MKLGIVVPSLLYAACVFRVEAAPAVEFPGPWMQVGNAVVVDFQGSVSNVDRASGLVTLLSGPGQFDVPVNAAISPKGDTLFVADQNAGGGTIFRVSVATGNLSVIVSGAAVNGVGAVALGSDGYLYAGRRAGALGPAAIVRIDRHSGIVVPISSGGLLDWPRDMEFGADGMLYVLEALYVGGGGIGAILRIDLASGAQSIVSSGGSFYGVQGIGTAANGLIYVADYFPKPHIVRVEIASGGQSIVAQDSLMGLPRDVAVERDGSLLVSDCCAAVPCPAGLCGQPAILRIDPSTGIQSVLATGGGMTTDPSGLVIFKGGSVTDVRPTTWGAIKASYR